MVPCSPLDSINCSLSSNTRMQTPAKIMTLESLQTAEGPRQSYDLPTHHRRFSSRPKPTNTGDKIFLTSFSCEPYGQPDELFPRGTITTVRVLLKGNRSQRVAVLFRQLQESIKSFHPLLFVHWYWFAIAVIYFVYHIVYNLLV